MMSDAHRREISSYFKLALQVGTLVYIFVSLMTRVSALESKMEPLEAIGDRLARIEAKLELLTEARLGPIPPRPHSGQVIRSGNVISVKP